MKQSQGLAIRPLELNDIMKLDNDLVSSSVFRNGHYFTKISRTLDSGDNKFVQMGGRRGRLLLRTINPLVVFFLPSVVENVDRPLPSPHTINFFLSPVENLHRPLPPPPPTQNRLGFFYTSSC